MTRQPTPADRDVTAELLARYDKPGPRYTSYPTAVEFEELAVDEYAARLARADELGDAPLSLYVHLPFCEERCTFCGCHVIISPDKTRAEPYIDLLEREFTLVAERLPQRRKFSQFHLGGGTPTYQSPAQLDRLMKHVESLFQPTANAELAVEVDPRVTRREHLDVLAAHGFNRISLGVQDFTPAVQESINRVQTVEETAAVVDHARSLGFRGINIDLIYGLPFQTAESFEHSIETAIGLGPDRSAVYSFAYVPWIRGHQKTLGEEDLPDRETKFRLFAIARERFLAHGYEPIGMDHFARPDDELVLARNEGRLRRNFQGYSVVPAEDVIGFGISAIGDVRGAYVQNAKKLSVYTQALAAGRLPIERGRTCTDDDILRRWVIHELMCNFTIDIPEVEARFGVDFGKTFAEDIARLDEPAKEGLVTVTPQAITATPTGELFVRNLAMCFDRYWREKHEDSDRSTFSRTV